MTNDSQFPEGSLRVLYFSELWKRVAKTHSRVALYGAGKHTQWLLGVVRSIAPAPRIACILDDDPKTDALMGYPVMRPADAAPSSYDALILSSDSFEDELYRRALDFADTEIVRPYEELATVLPRKQMSNNGKQEREESIQTISTPRGSLRFECSNKLTTWRAKTLLTKEPETIAWLDSFDPDMQLWDIGANIGVYSLYAALDPTAQVLAFEPAAVNYHILNRNIQANGLDDRIQALCVAFTETPQLSSFLMSTTDAGSALHGFNTDHDWQGNRFVPTFRQGMLGLSLDSFIAQYSPRFPDHIKIDVDGIEDRIIRGASRTLSSSRLRSVLVELDTARDDYSLLCAAFDQAGLKLTTRAHAENFDSTEFASVYNHIFERT